MKKILALALVFVLVFSLAACGGEDSENTYTAENPLVFRFAYVNATEDVAHIAAEKFEKAVEEASEGAIQVELYPNGELGGDVAVLESVLMDDVQMTAPALSSMASYDEKLGLLELPFLFEDYDSMNAALEGSLGELYSSWAEEAGFKLIGFQFDGTRCVSSNGKPIKSLADFKGLKIRVMENPIHISTMKALGASPIPLPYGDIYTGLQQGTIAAQDNPPALTYASKFFEVQDYYSLTNIIISNPPVVVSKSVFEGYPEEFQKIILDAAQEHLINYQRTENYNEEQNFIQMINDGGCEVVEVSDSAIAEFKEAVQPVYDECYDKFGAEVMDTLLEAAK